MVIIKNEDARVLRIDLTTHAPIAGAKIAILHVAWPRRAFMFDGLAAPGPVLAMRRNDHPFFAQRMPALFPSHIRLIWSAPAERSGDGALDLQDTLQFVRDLNDKLKFIEHPKRRRCCALPAHSTLVTLARAAGVICGRWIRRAHI